MYTAGVGSYYGDFTGYVKVGYGNDDKVKRNDYFSLGNMKQDGQIAKVPNGDFEIYGSNDGREIKILGPKVLAVKEDGSMKTLLTQEVYILGKLLRRDQFYSIYKSPASYTLEENPLD